MHGVSAGSAIPSVTIRVSGKLFQGHLAYLDRLIQAAADCSLWVVLDLERLVEMDREALLYVMKGEGREFDLVSCPNFIREWMAHESEHRVA
jgi:hypothetical protein